MQISVNWLLALATSSSLMAFGCDEMVDSSEEQAIESKTDDGEERPIQAEAEAEDEALTPEGADGLEDLKDALDPSLAAGWCCDCPINHVVGGSGWSGSNCSEKSDSSFCSTGCFATCSGNIIQNGDRTTCQ